jgi:hypothetical protein
MPSSPPPPLTDEQYAAGVRIVAVQARIRDGEAADISALTRLGLAALAFVIGVAVLVVVPGGVRLDLSSPGRPVDHLAVAVLCLAVAFALLLVRPHQTAAKEAGFGPGDAAALRGYVAFDRSAGAFRLTAAGRELRDRFERDHWHDGV